MTNAEQPAETSAGDFLRSIGLPEEAQRVINTNSTGIIAKLARNKARETYQALRQTYDNSEPMIEASATQPPHVDTPQLDEANKPDQWGSIPGRVDFDAKGNPITPERGRPTDDYFKYYYIAQKLKIPVDRLEFYKLTPYNDADTFSARNAEWKRRNKLQRDNRGKRAVKRP